MSLAKTCFSSFVFGNYQKYIPYYIYSIWKIYPNASVKIFIETQLQIDIDNVLNSLKKNGVNNFEIIELNTSYAEYENFKMKGSGAKTLIRWLFGYENFKDFEYVYIGDIDIFFLPEETSLINFHQKQMKLLGHPFSNKVRIDKNGNLTERLTGLHFIKVKEYFEKIEPIITKIKNDSSFKNDYLYGLERNENFLYKINKEAFKFNDEILSKAQRPWHGLHLGITRGNKGVDVNIIKDNSSLSIDEIKKHLLEYSKDPIFKKIQNMIFVQEFEVILRELRILYPLSWKWKGLIVRANYKLRDIKMKIKDLLK